VAAFARQKRRIVSQELAARADGLRYTTLKTAASDDVMRQQKQKTSLYCSILCKQISNVTFFTPCFWLP
jgi:hypothetical protein